MALKPKPVFTEDNPEGLSMRRDNAQGASYRAALDLVLAKYGGKAKFQRALEGAAAPPVQTAQAKPDVRRLDPGEFIQNQDGSRSTELSLTVTEPALNQGRPTNIPSVYNVNGKIGVYAQDQAVGLALATGEEYPSFDTIAEAVQAAEDRSDAGGRFADIDPGQPLSASMPAAPEVTIESIMARLGAAPKAEAVTLEGIMARLERADQSLTRSVAHGVVRG
ncbi:hypothetical protein LCGC14_3160580, partial [marine sediment metagenome]